MDAGFLVFVGILGGNALGLFILNAITAGGHTSMGGTGRLVP